MVTIRTNSRDGRFLRLSFADTPWGAIGSVISAGIGAWSSNRAAKKQLQAVRETNETNLRLAQEQRDWDLEQWNRENEYNSASAQLARWQQAGFSPHSFLGVGSPGEAAALQSPDMANQVAPPDMSGYAHSFAQSIQSGIKGVLDWKQLDLEQEQLNLNKERLANETSVAEAQVNHYNAMTDEAKANVKFIEEQAKFTEQQRYLSNAQLEKVWQEFEQSAKLFPHVFGKVEAEAKQKALDYLFSKQTYDKAVEQVALNTGKTKAEIYKITKEGLYWAWQAKEGEFTFDTQDLRWSILRTQSDQMKFDLKFNQDTRYSSWSFDRWMRGIHAASEIGHLIIDGAGEIRNWIHPGNWLGNTKTFFGRDDKGRISSIERSFEPFSRY